MDISDRLFHDWAEYYKALSFIAHQNHVNTINVSDTTRHRATHVLTSELILNSTIVCEIHILVHVHVF